MTLPLLVRRLRNRLARTPLRKPFCWYRNRSWTERDVFLGEYPKSGITWLRFLLYEALTGQPATGSEVNRVVIDRSWAAPIFPNGGRLIPTHEPWRPQYSKAIYLVRDARDVVLSEFAFEKALGLFSGDLDAFIRAFLRGAVNSYGTWHQHVDSWLDAAQNGAAEVLLVKYDDLRRGPDVSLAHIVGFLGAEVSEASIHSAVANNTLEKMRAKEDEARRTSVRGKAPLRSMDTKSAGGNRFVREGKIGGWRDRLAPAQIALIESRAGRTLSRLGYPLEAHAGEAPGGAR